MRNLVHAKKWSICLIAVAVAACSQAGENKVAADGNAAANAQAAPGGGNAASAGATAETYRASGTEPFWSLTIDGGRMVYDSADGPDVTVATPAQQPTRAGYRYVTPEMTVTVNNFRRCEAASGEVYHDTVQVIVGGQTVDGCGGEAAPA